MVGRSEAAFSLPGLGIDPQIVAGDDPLIAEPYRR